MNILLHMCCAPCTVYPLKTLRSEGMAVTGFFFNHNIHPYQEYRHRLETVKEYAEMVDLKLLLKDEYLLEDFLAAVAANPESRCLYCYASRLEQTAKKAVELGFEAFTSSLLYSRYQNHKTIMSMGENIGREHGVKFYYMDFRSGWQEGIRISKEIGLYRQKYCGCIYSEKERYHPKVRR